MTAMTTFATKTTVASMRLLVTVLAVVPMLPHVCPAASVTGTLVREAVEMACRKSGREVAEKASREAVEHSVAVGVAKYGPRAAQAVADGASSSWRPPRSTATT